MGGLTGSPRLRIVALVLGSLATLAMVIVGCSSVTEGTPKVNATDAPVYRASVSASIEESAASSSAQESKRQASEATKAIHTLCEALSSSSVDSITAVNDYVKAFNENAADVQAKSGPAVDALNHSADAVATSISDPLPQDLQGRPQRLGRRRARGGDRHSGQLWTRRFQRRSEQAERRQDTRPGLVRRRISMNLVRRALPDAQVMRR